MSVTQHTLNVLLAVVVLCVGGSARLSPAAAGESQTTTVEMRADAPRPWTARKFPASEQQGPLARLIRTPDTSDGLPPYALTDQTGRVQRYVEPVPGIDLEPYVGYVVVVKHDTGRTLLASQLELPGADVLPSIGNRDKTYSIAAGQIDSMGPIQPVQYQQQVMPQQQVIMPQGVMPIDESGQVMMVPPQMTAQGVPPIYVDGPTMYDGASCQASVPYTPTSGNVWVVPQQPAPCNTCPTGGPCQTVPCQTVPCQTAPCQQQVPCQQPVPCAQPLQYQTIPAPQPCPPQQPCPQPCPPPCPPPRPPELRWAVWGEFLWLRPKGVDMAHAQQQNGTDPPGSGAPGTVPWGQIGTASPDYDIGWRAGGEWRFSECESIFASYTFYSSDAVSTVVPPAIPDGTVGSYVQHPGEDLTFSDGPVQANYDIKFQLGDLACRQVVFCDPCSVWSVFLGARYGHLEQDFLQSEFLSVGGDSISTSTNVKVDAIGPMAGVDYEHLIGRSRFSFYGRALVAALNGEFKSRYRTLNVTTEEQMALSLWNDNRIIPMLDYELGVAWTGPNRHIRLAAGYLGSHWFNVVTTPVEVNAVKADNYVNVDDTISFDGLTAHAEFRW